jgi:hypothetical protein
MRYASYKILGERYSGLRVASSGLLVMQTGTKSEFKMLGEILFEINGPCQIGKSLHLLKSFKLPRSQIHSDSRQESRCEGAFPSKANLYFPIVPSLVMEKAWL